ncbi:multifunctional 2',3'-cyclic-nucleotide 2'-phosphodiesterase/5'-nucleotidase/3'-nucleotidase [Pararhodospirillum oryzae]|uniref:Multifunctional 2',3'-cyclic-nucleotide 2'-phosphodiesterase/5'-nucleotidase/3'-nucleotidase n=1 Tax=Pararhodospirillum oryzae TaxID=478448 RepID=A0A512H5V0_9PROT|nr:multifunctional 2',3'-cyclic-nucleotide 2'-phosphodiesterase/5'-nucleotidase/3'-nucleotidase [Pararhodospirillum oryzae]
MRMRIPGLTVAGALLLAGTMLFPALAGAADLRAPVTVRLLHVNDVYEVAPDRQGLGGLAELKTLVGTERARSGADQVLVTFGGDLLSPSLLSSLDQGAHMLVALNEVGVDVAVPGNHEFDFGAGVAARLLGGSPFPWLLANAQDPTGAPFAGLAPTMLKTVGPYRVGFLGVLTPDTETLSSPGAGITFQPVEERARAAVQALKAQGADVIIALTHQDMADDRKLADALPEVDVILGGHDHEILVWGDDGRLIVKAGSDARTLAAVDLRVSEHEGKEGPVLDLVPALRLIPNQGQTPDPALAQRIQGWEKALDDSLGQPLGVSVKPLDSRRAVVRGEESTVGDLIADALRTGTRADVALTNGGGIRGDKLYEAGTTLTLRDVVTELPFGNVAVVLTLSGADLRAALEHGFSGVENGAGRFPQVSGMSVTWTPDRPPGQRVLAVTVNGQPLQDGRAYLVATNDFIANGGDGYDILVRAPRLVDASAARLMTTLVGEYIKAQGTVDLAPEGRLVKR